MEQPDRSGIPGDAGSGRSGRSGRSRLLAVRGGALGDFILTLPALRALTRAGHELELLTRPAYGRLAQDFGWVSGWRALDSPAASLLLVAGAEIDPGWQDWLGGFEAVVSWVPDPDGVFQQQVLRCGVPHFYQGDWRCPGPEPAAVQLARGALPTGAGVPGRFELFGHAPAAARPVPHWFALHPGSGSPRKNWPLEHWIGVMQEIQRSRPGAHWLVITGEAEADRLAGFTAALHQSGLSWEGAGGLDLTRLACRLRDCAVFFGHDSGVSHLAAACGVPCRLLFGPTSPAVWAPQGDHVRVLAAPQGDLGRLGPATVLDWLAGDPPGGGGPFISARPFD